MKTVRGGPEVTATLWISLCPVASTNFQVSPPSLLWRAPSTSRLAQILFGSTGSTAIPVNLGVPTASHSAATSIGRWSQGRPPSFERNNIASVCVVLPTYMLSGLTVSSRCIASSLCDLRCDRGLSPSSHRAWWVVLRLLLCHPPTHRRQPRLLPE